jgi:hypothetical protein
MMIMMYGDNDGPPHRGVLLIYFSFLAGFITTIAPHNGNASTLDFLK